MKKLVLLLTALLLSVNVVFAEVNPLYDQVWKLVNSKYVDKTNNKQNWERWRYKYDNVIKTPEDSYVAIETMLASLNDPYTKFLDPKEFSEETNSIKGSLKGIGVQIGLSDGKLVIIAPIEDTPGEKAGLKAEDEILEIDGKSTKGIKIDAAADKIRGEEGTFVELLIRRKGVPDKLYRIQRAEFEIKSVSTKIVNNYKLDPQIGYIRLSSFISKNAATDVLKAIDRQKDKKGYILDLRLNPGGLLSNAIVLSDAFLPGGIIVSTVDRDGYKDTMKASRRYYTDKPLIVLINKGSASASEIFSGAMKDNKRALIVGERSFGKGLVQEVNRLQDGAGINITVQRYLTPSGTDIHKKGIEPDVVVELTDEDIKNKKDTQLIKAEELMREMIKISDSRR